MHKLVIVLSLLVSMAPVCAIDQKPYVVDLYTAIKNNTGLRSYFIWRTSAEKEAVKAAEAAGESVPAVYHEAAEYAYDQGDARTAATLKQGYARQYLFSLPLTATFLALAAGGIKLAQRRLQYIRDNTRTQVQIDDLRARIGSFKVFNEELKEMGQPQVEPKAFPDKKDIAGAYRKLSKRWHPDMPKNRGNKEQASEKFIRIDDAYKILTKNFDEKPQPFDD